MYQLGRIVEELRICVLYYFQHGFDRAFLHEEMMHITKDTQGHPEWVSNWK